MFVHLSFKMTPEYGGNSELHELGFFPAEFATKLTEKGGKLTVLWFLATSMACFTSGGSSMTE